MKEREKNGLYKDIFDFAERVDLSNVNRKAFESLAFSGGFDSFGLQREQFFCDNGKGVIFLDTLVRYAQLYQQEKSQMQNSLFGGDDAVDVIHPPIPKGEKWATIEKLNKERDLVGVYLSAHPLDEYGVILNHLCNTHAAEIARDMNMDELAKRDEITFGGIITAVNERFSQKTGKPFGFVTIEDFEGSGELALFGDDWIRWNGLMKENYTIYVTAKCQPRYRNSNLYEIKVQNVEQLYDVKAHRLQRFTISMDAMSVDSSTVSDLLSIVDENPGDTQLYIQLRTPEQNTVMLHRRSKGVNVDKKLLDFVKADGSMEYSIN